MAWTGVQSKTATSATAGTAVSCTFDSAPTPGNFLMAAIGHSGIDYTLVSSYGGAYTASGNICMAETFGKMAEEGESATFTMTLPSAASWAVVIKEYGDINGSEVTNDFYLVDASKASGTNSYTLNLTGLREYNDLCIACFGQQPTAHAASWSAGWTEIADITPASSPTFRLAVAEQEIPTLQTVNMTVTLAGNTSQSPTIVHQACFAYGDPGRSRPMQQSWAQR